MQGLSCKDIREASVSPSVVFVTRDNQTESIQKSLSPQGVTTPKLHLSRPRAAAVYRQL